MCSRWFLFCCKKATCCRHFLKSVLGYGDVLYMQTSAQCLSILDTVHHTSLRFITTVRMSCSALCHWYTFIWQIWAYSHYIYYTYILTCGFLVFVLLF